MAMRERALGFAVLTLAPPGSSRSERLADQRAMA